MESKEHSHLAFEAQFTIGIVGFGPKGLYALERLLAHLKTSNIKTPIAIHIFNQNHFFGAGNVYRIDQPPYLIMNYANENIDSWFRGKPDAIFPKPPNFCKWLSEKINKPIEDFSKEFASRAMVGNYLMESFKILKENAPSNVNVIPHVATVQKITKDNIRFNLQGNKEGLDFSIAFDNLILTTGHAGSGSHFQPTSNPSNIIEFIYPISQKLKHIEGQSNIAVKGFGLTAIDAILALTEGRGGIFVRDKKGNLSYKVSGREPYKIFPFSRTGLPMFPRGINSDDDSQLYFFSDEVVRNLQTIPNLSFQEDILPIIKKEFRFSYYKILFRNYEQELKFDSNAAIIDEQIEQFHNTHSSEKRFFWKILTDPFSDQEIIPHAEMHTYIKFLIQEAEKGTEKSPIMAAAGIWRKISPIFNKLYSFAGLDANSHQLFDTSFFGFFNRIAYGPPIKNMKKILALSEAEIIDFSFVRNPKISSSTGKDKIHYKLQNRQLCIDINYLINARIPRNNSQSYSELYANLLKEGLIRPFTNKNDGFYNPGSFDIDSKGRVYAPGGYIQENITMYGTPTEGVTFDNDTLSRERNNFASHWAHDIGALLLKKEQKNRKKMINNTKYVKGNPEGGLTPITSPWMHQLFENEELLSDLFGKFSSPINIHHLPTFASTISSYKEVFESYDLNYQIFYARKANKSKSLVKQAFGSGIGVDTASLRELEQSIALGGKGDNLVLTAAIKTKEQYSLAIQNEIPIILDNFDELEQANNVAKQLNKKAIIGIRVSGFIVEESKLYSRFGFDIEKAEQFISKNLDLSSPYQNLKLKGLHFHLDGYSTQQRGKALSDCLNLIRSLNAKAFDISFIDIGGGILMNYLESEQEWTDFETKLKKAVQDGRNQLTFNNDGLGYEMVDGKLCGSLKTYPYFNKVNGTTFIKEVLDYSNLQTGKTNAQELKELQLELRIEPGRSLLNRTGITLAKVAHRKQDAKGQWLVGLEMNMTQMMSSSKDFLLDPFIIYKDPQESNASVDVFFTGAYCLERDVLLKRKISLPTLPKIGDFVAFVNTAGYMMHFFETEAHLFDLSTNLFLSSQGDFTLTDFIDDNALK